jgi:hypothetical protein
MSGQDRPAMQVGVFALAEDVVQVVPFFRQGRDHRDVLQCQSRFGFRGFRLSLNPSSIKIRIGFFGLLRTTRGKRARRECR